MFEDDLAPTRDAAHVSRELAHRPRPVVRPPRQCVVGHALEEAARGAHLVIVVREERVLDRHLESLPKTRSDVRTQREVQPQRHRDTEQDSSCSLCVSVSPWLVMLCVLCALCLSSACHRAEAPLPPLVAQVSGTMSVDGLTAPVRIVRDSWGVPHIYAQNDADLFFAQGFVQAQDRLFQMDLWRRSAQGRLSEVLGPNFIERDAMTRRIQYRGDMDAEWKSYGAGAKAIAEAFVGGVNAWVTLARERPPEEFVLAGWKPELWSADDLLDRTEAFVESGDALDEVFRARLIATVGLARARLLLAEDRPLNPAAGVDPAVVPALVA